MIPDEPKFWWDSDVKFFGQPKAEQLKHGTRVFAFKRKEYFPTTWYIKDNMLCRYPYGASSETRNWKLNKKQIEAFYRDWEKFHNGNHS